MPSTGLSPQPQGFNFNKNISLLNNNASLGFEFSSQLQQDVATALLSTTMPFPARDIELAEIGLKASTTNPIEFARGADKISFTASGGAFAGLGIYHTGAALLQKLGEHVDDFSLDALEFSKDDQSVLSILRWGYSAEGKASGAMALGAVGTATLSVSGNAEGLFATVRRLPANTPARAVVQQTADSWMLPRQISSIDQVEPGTWILAEVIGGLSITLGAQLGYDFNWVREAQLGGLSGDIGLRLQMGINAAVGFSASGRCAVVVSRESDDETLRLRFFRLRTRELDLSFDASVAVQSKVGAILPDKVDDFIAAVFGTHGQQILKDLQVIEKWTDPNANLSDLLAQAGVNGAEKLIANLVGITPGQLQSEFDKVHATAVAFIQKWHDLPHTVSSAILKMVENKVDLTDVRNVAQQLSTITADGLRSLLDNQLSRIDFFHTPVGQLLESVVDGSGVLSLLEKPLAGIQEIGKKAVAVLDGSLMEDTLKNFQSFVETELHLEKILDVVNDTDFAALDALLKRKLAAFLGQDNIVLQDLDKIRKTLRLLLDKTAEYYDKALEALRRKYTFEFTATYQSTTTNEALLDATFDFSHDPASVSGFLQQALQGKLDDLFETQPPQVAIATGKITHGIKRQRQIDVTLPFMSISDTHLNDSLASVEAVGGGLLFKLQASDTVASNQRKSTLSLAMALSKVSPNADAIRLHQDSLELDYTLLYAKKNMQIKHVRAQIGPAVKEFFSDKIPDTDKFLAFIDQHTEEKIPNGPNVLGNGLIALQISLSPSAAMNAGQAWLGLPTDRSASVYTDLSRAIQISLKKCVRDSFFSEPEDYVSADAPLFLAYCAIVPRAPVAQGPQGQPFWDFASPDERRKMLLDNRTVQNMQQLFVRAQDVLKGSSDAQFFNPENAFRTLDQLNANDSRLIQLLAAEAEMIGSAFKGGLKIASSLQKAPTEAVAALADFGSKLTESFNAEITTLLGPGLQSLGTRIFLDASRSLDANLAAEITEANAMLSLEFLKPDSKFDENALLAAGSVDDNNLAFADRVVQLIA